MNDKRKALGRGLEQLFNDEGLNFDTIENSIIEEAKTNDQIVEIKQRKKDEFEEISLYDAISKVEDIMDGE